MYRQRCCGPTAQLTEIEKNRMCITVHVILNIVALSATLCTTGGKQSSTLQACRSGSVFNVRVYHV